MIVGLLFIAVLIAVTVIGIRKVMSGQGQTTSDSHAMRRFFQYLLLFGLLTVTAIGFSGLLSRLFSRDTLIAADDAALARSVAFTVVGTPLLVIVALWTHRRIIDDPTERTSSAWASYATVTSLTALVVTMFALHDLLSWATGLQSSNDWALPNLIVWGTAWSVHWWLDARLTPDSSSQAHHLLGSLIGLGTAAVGLSALLAGSLETLLGLDDDRALLVAGPDPILRGAVTLAVGAPVWLLYWVWTASRSRRNSPWLAYVILAGIGGGLVTALVSTSFVLYDILVWLVGEPGTTDATRHFQNVPAAAGAAVVGILVWWYHHAVLAEGGRGIRTEVERIREYLMAGIGLLAAAGGLTMVLVALIEAVAGSGVILGGSAVNTLLAALTLLIVGGPVWWYFWRLCQTAARTNPKDGHSSPSRRIYLFLLLGLATVAAVIALLVGVYFLFEDVLAGTYGSGTIRRMRFPIGILVTAGAIAAYHWTVYGGEREQIVSRLRGPRYVLLVGPPDAELAGTVARKTGGKVRALSRTDGVGTPWSAEEVLAVLGATNADEVVVLSDADGLHTIPVRRG